MLFHGLHNVYQTAAIKDAEKMIAYPIRTLK